MARFSALLGLLALGLSAAAPTESNSAAETCQEIQDRISEASDVFYPCKLRETPRVTRNTPNSSLFFK